MPHQNEELLVNVVNVATDFFQVHSNLLSEDGEQYGMLFILFPP
jgi:hypothetical protein